MDQKSSPSKRCSRALRRVLWAPALFGGLALAVSAHAVRTADPAGAVVPDNHGTIDEITIHYDETLSAELVPFYRDLFASLGDDVHVKVLCAGREPMLQFADTWAPAVTGRGRTLELINTGLEMTVWARDRVVARQSRDLSMVLPSFVPIARYDYDDSKLNEVDANLALAALNLAPPIMPTLVRLEGGNIVASRHHAFIGVNVLEENPEVGFENGGLLRQLDAITGLSVVPVRADEDDVPWCHVDMYLTPIDDRTLLVADMNLGLTLMRLDSSAAEGPCGEEQEPLINASTWVPEQLDEIAVRMGRLGFAVGRLPAFVDPAGAWMVTYNNVLIEERDGRKRVLMPVYGLPALDEVAARTYAAFGFEVATIDVTGLYDRGGALRCIVNVTRRRAPNTPSPADRIPGQIEMYDVAPEVGRFVSQESAEEDPWVELNTVCPNAMP